MSPSLLRFAALFAFAAAPLFAQEEAPAPKAPRGGQKQKQSAPQLPPSKILDYYDIEDIPLPPGAKNTDGVAFMPDGRLVACFMAGQVYFYNPKTKEWKLFADGLHWPLGVLPVSNNEVLVMQVPELTLLADRDGDGKAEVFKTVSDYFGLSGNYAEFQTGPVRDKQGNLFYTLGTGSHFGMPLTNEVRGFYSPQGATGRMTSPVPYRGWVMKVSPDGKTTPYAVGMREANGIGFDPQGRLYSIDNQGDWVGSSALYHVQEGHFYGHVPPLVWREDFQGGVLPIDTPVAELDKLRTRAAVVFPYGDMSNSPTQPLADMTGGKFGPFAGQMFIGEMNYRRIMRVMLEEVDGQMQGAVSPFFDHPKLHLGNVRLAFAPDGSLWVGQTLHQGWVGESGLQRISWKGVMPFEVQTMKVTDDGFDLNFTKPVNAEIAAKPETYTIDTYFYNYHEAYGSSKFDHHPVKIASVTVSRDKKRVSLHLENLEAWRIYDMKFKDLVSADGKELVNPWIVYNLNHLTKNTPPPRAPIEYKEGGDNGAPKRPVRRRPQTQPGGVKGIGGPQDFKATH